ncbi:MAG: BlaI/MecI/CopY family transcriptional regulator [Bdellovibrionales bacterium]|nr:BlaI/MecI/CopY family transcriptional regulator [Bdellovibrionales bacterium]
MARPKDETEKPLTDTELLIMNALWDLKAGTVNDVSERISKEQGKDYAYTTVSTLLRILEKKSVVQSQKEGRGHKYFPLIQKENYQQKATHHLVENVFSGEATQLIRNLLGNSQFSKEELSEIKKLLDGKKK